MRELTVQEVEVVSGGYESSGGWAADAILTGGGALVGFCLGGGPTPMGFAGAAVGAELGHALAKIMID